MNEKKGLVLGKEGRFLPIRYFSIRYRWASVMMAAPLLLLALLLALMEQGAVRAAQVLSIAPPGLADWTTQGEAALQSYGRSVHSAGDVNNDGFDDVIVATTVLTNSGRIFLYHGGPGGLSLTPNFTATGEAINDFFGTAVSSAGDTNHDGIADFIVSAPSNDGDDEIADDLGRVYVYLGQAGGLDPTLVFTATGDVPESLQADQYGEAVAGAGDVNNDTFDDVIVGAWQNDESADDAGKVYLYFGGPGGPTQTGVFTLTGEAELDAFGKSVDYAGDVNHDGIDDFVVGAPQNDEFAQDAGKIYVYYGSTGSLSKTPSFTATGDLAGAEFGFDVGHAGDVNGDGYDDLAVGAYRSGGTGKVFVYYGSPSGLSRENVRVLNGEFEQDEYGVSVDGAGDANGDGFADLLVGALGVQNRSGRVYLYEGCIDGPRATAVFTATGEGTGHNFGHNVSAAGDVNNDNLDDLLVGAFGYRSGFELAVGKAYAYYGVEGGCRAAVELTKTVSIDGVEALCSGTQERHVPVNTTMAYCYMVRNSGTVTLTLHSLDNSPFGEIVSGHPFELAPGALYTYSTTRTHNVSVSEVTTWTGTISIPMSSRVLSATDAATVTLRISSDADDQDEDSIPDNVETAGDADGDAVPNFLDTDSDDDGFDDVDEVGPNPQEPEDKNENTVPGYLDKTEFPEEDGVEWNPAILLTATMGIDGIEPVCGGTASIKVPLDTTVAYCFTVQNTGDVTLTHHSLLDNELGAVVETGTAIELLPGATHTEIVTGSLDFDLATTAQWTAWISASLVGGEGTGIISATATVTTAVTMAGPTDDVDGDTIPDNTEGSEDADDDNIPNFEDVDADDDGFDDVDEVGPNPQEPEDKNENTVPGYLDDSESPDGEEPETPKVYLPMVTR